MLKCRDVPERAEQLLDGQLSFWQRFGLRFHLFLCHDCRRYLRNLKVLLGALRQSGTDSEDSLNEQQARDIAHRAINHKPHSH